MASPPGARVEGPSVLEMHLAVHGLKFIVASWRTRAGELPRAIMLGDAVEDAAAVRVTATQVLSEEAEETARAEGNDDEEAKETARAEDLPVVEEF